MPSAVSYREQRTFLTRFAAMYLLWFVLTTLFAASPLSDTGMLRFTACTTAIVMPVVAFGVAYRRSPGLRDAVLRLDLSSLHFFQIARLAGIGMLAVYAVGRLAPPFALWAGGIDIVIGLSATFVAFLVVPRDPLPRRALIAWNTLGLLDFVVAFALWFLWSPTYLGALAHHSDTTQMLRLPLSFIPLAGVPVASIVHISALLQLHAHNYHPPYPVLHPRDQGERKPASAGQSAQPAQ